MIMHAVDDLENGAMASRKRVADAIQADVLVKSRRRCCVCFGLSRDEEVKQGQIAHLDHDPSNKRESNLAFMCLPHHDQYDSKTSQSKNLTETEVRRYREELYRHFSPWGPRPERTEFLLNYVAASMDAKSLAETLWKVGRRVEAFPDFAIKVALTKKEIDLMNADDAMPLLHVLDSLASWGFLTYEFEEPDNQNRHHYTFRINLDLPPDAVQELLQAVDEIEARELERWRRSPDEPGGRA
jgi:hypothetical protein